MTTGRLKVTTIHIRGKEVAGEYAVQHIIATIAENLKAMPVRAVAVFSGARLL